MGSGDGEIYELNEECAADIPERGDFFSWAEYQRVGFDVPRFRPDGQLLAVTGDELVGRTWGATHLRTVHHPNNNAIITANRKLGFHDADFNLRPE